MIKTLKTNDAPLPIGPYSQGVMVGQWIFLSGQIGLDPVSGELVSPDLDKQLVQIFKNMEAVLKSAGANLKNITKLTVFIKDISQFSTVNEIMQHYLYAPYPARSTIEVSKLPKNASIEIEAIAVNTP